MDHVTLHCVDQACVRAASRYRQQLGSRTKGLATIAATAPFFGLLGTCMGIRNSFLFCCYRGGIIGILGEALLTTALSLALAVASYWSYYYCSQQLEVFEVEMAAVRQILLSVLQRQSIPAK